MAITNITLQQVTSAGDTLYADSIGSDKAQIVKVATGQAGTADLISTTDPMPVDTVRATNDGGVLWDSDKIKRMRMHKNGASSTFNAVEDYSGGAGIYQAMASTSSGGYLLVRSLHIFARAAGVSADYGDDTKFFEGPALGTSIQVSVNSIATPATVQDSLIDANLATTWAFAEHANMFHLEQTAGFTLMKCRIDFGDEHGAMAIHRSGASAGSMFCVTLNDDMREVTTGLKDFRMAVECIDISSTVVSKHFDTVII